MIGELTKSKWKLYREKLEDDVRNFYGFTSAKIKRYDDYVMIENGLIQVGFSDIGKLFVTNRCSRYSEKPVYVDNLVELQNVITQWMKYVENTEGHDEKPR